MEKTCDSRLWCNNLICVSLAIVMLMTTETTARWFDAANPLFGQSHQVEARVVTLWAPCTLSLSHSLVHPLNMSVPSWWHVFCFFWNTHLINLMATSLISRNEWCTQTALRDWHTLWAPCEACRAYLKLRAEEKPPPPLHALRIKEKLLIKVLWKKVLE